MKIIGLLGGVGCGKSTVAGYLHLLGAPTIDGDKIAHEVLNIPEIIDLMEIRWGRRLGNAFNRTYETVVDSTVRHAIAKIVFADPKELDFLEAITWPEMRRMFYRKLELYDNEYTPAVVIDFPLLVDSGFGLELQRSPLVHVETNFQYWFVECEEIKRFAQFRKRRAEHGVVESTEECLETFQARESRQKGIEGKRGMAHVIIKNDGIPESMLVQIREAWGKYVV
jgi:dephospho-CoA kinase